MEMKWTAMRKIKQEIDKKSQRRNTLVAQKSVLQEQMRENTVRIIIKIYVLKRKLIIFTAKL